MHPDIIADITGVKLENDYENTVGPELQLEEEPIKYMAQCAGDDRKNFDQGKNAHKTHEQIKGVDNVIEIYLSIDLEEDDDDDSVYMSNLFKQEDIDSIENELYDEYVGDNPEEVSV